MSILKVISKIMSVKSKKRWLRTRGLTISELHLSASCDLEIMWRIVPFVLVLAHPLKGLTKEEFPSNVYRDCRISSTSRISIVRQRVVNDERGTGRWMCFGSTPIPSVGTINSDNIGGLYNKTIVVAYRIEDPYVMVQRSKDTKSGKKLTGYLVDLWTRLQKKLKFKTEFVAMDLEEIKQRLSTEGVDVFLYPEVHTSESSEYFQFTLPVASHWHSLFLRRLHVEVAPDAHVRAMGYNMIHSALNMVFLVSLSLWFSEVIGAWLLHDRKYRSFETPYRTRIVPFEAKSSSWKRFLESFTMVSLSNCFLSALSPLCLQNWFGQSRRLSSRVVLLCSFIFGFVLVNMYNAVLMSHLAAGSRDVPDVTQLEEIAANGGYVLCVRKDTYAYSTFLEYPDGPVLPMWREVLNGWPCPEEAHTAEQLLQALCKGEGSALERYMDTVPHVGVLEVPGVMAAALERPPAAQKDRHHSVHRFKKCRLVRMRRRHIVNMVSLMVRRRFPHTTELNIEILNNRAAGLLDYLESKWMGRNRLQIHAPWWDGSVSNPIPTTQISLLHIRTILHSFVTSLLVSVFILGCEIIICRTPWRHSLLGCYHPSVVQRGALKGPPSRVTLPEQNSHLKRIMWK